MKKFFAIICAVLLMTGCGSEKPADDKKISIGIVTRLNASEENFNDFMSRVEDGFDVKISSHKFIFFDSLSQMQAALQSGQVDEISTYRSVARYMVAKDPRFAVLKDHSLEFIDSFCFAVREDDTELKNLLDAAIKEMQSDGTLDRLTKDYITDISAENDPPAVELPHFDNAPTIKVAVTGDLPPLDFVSANGKPAGFNTAVLAEIGNRLSRNVELVEITAASRAASLMSNQADVVFWAIVPVSEIIPSDTDKPEGVALTEPYCKDKIVHVTFTAEETK